MHLELTRSPSKNFPRFTDPRVLRSLVIWHCKYASLRPIGQCLMLDTLVIATFPDAALDFLSGLAQLRYLQILHLPRVHDLSPLAGLRSLEVLSLETLPSWDASGKVTTVDSLEPIARLPKLRHLQLFGVRSALKSLTELEGCPSLVSARISKIPKKEADRFRAKMNLSEAWNPQPDYAKNRPKPSFSKLFARVRREVSEPDENRAP